jgi:membrane protein implicated in regulation of membrane protease activity
MDQYVIWALVGLGLVIVELLSGTFYLLMLGIAAFGAAIAAFAGAGFPLQVIVAAVVAAAGCWGVHVWRSKHETEQMPNVDAGQPASFESWIDEGARLARVRYRGTQWDARIDGDAPIVAGTVVYVTNTQGSTLAVTTQRPS